MDPSSYFIDNSNSTFSRINWNYTTNCEIYKVIKSLMTESLYGHDEIPIKILKLSAPLTFSP
jgi:hypothetical protein